MKELLLEVLSMEIVNEKITTLNGFVLSRKIKNYPRMGSSIRAWVNKGKIMKWEPSFSDLAVVGREVCEFDDQT